MQAYLNDEKLKDKTISDMELDIKAQRLVQGTYWNSKKQNGCFVGCVIRGDAHAKFELVLGIPRILARLADGIFEGLKYEDAKKFSVDFLQSIPVGADLSGVWDKFAYFLLVDPECGVIRLAKKNATKKSIQDVANMYQRKINGEKIDSNVWLDLKQSAAAAAAYASAAAYAYADAVGHAADAYAAVVVVVAADAYAAVGVVVSDARSRHFAALAAALIKFLSEAGR